MGVLRAKVVALATLATVAMLAACAPAAEGGPATAAPPSAEASTGPSVTPSLDASESPRPTLRPRPTLSAEPLLTDDPGIDGDYDGTGDGDYYDDQPSGPSTWTYRYAPTDGYPTYYPEVLPPTNDDGTVGSGCPPESGALPDGVWRAFPTDMSYQEWPAWIKVDIACSYSFEYPDKPETNLNSPYSDVQPRYTLTNDDNTFWVLPIAEDAIGYGASSAWAPVTWNHTWAGCGLCDTWIWVNDGEVTELAWPYDWDDRSLEQWKNGNS